MFKSLVKVGLVAGLMVGSLNAKDTTTGWLSMVSAVTTQPEVCHKAYREDLRFSFGNLKNGIGSCSGDYANIEFKAFDKFDNNNNMSLMSLYGSFLKAINKPLTDFSQYCEKTTTGAVCVIKYTDVSLMYSAINGYKDYSLNISKTK